MLRVIDHCLDQSIAINHQPAEILEAIEQLSKREFPTLAPGRHRNKIANYIQICRKSLGKSGTMNAAL